MGNNKKSKFTRRQFIGTGAVAAAGFTIVPRHVLGNGYRAPSDTVNIAGIGAGGKGYSDVKECWGNGISNVVALCDVDDRQSARLYGDFPKAAIYKDFRVMLDKQSDIDAVTVSTPDHTHAVAAMAAMQMGKHVYVQKPLTHNIYEARMLTEAARKYGIVTQMGNQYASGDGTQKTVEYINAGLIGNVHTVHAWTNRPVWPQGIPKPTGEHDIPAELDWDLWLGPANMRSYNPAYLPFKWRGWWDFGTGALGDMACHIVDPAFRALKLGHPVSVEANVAAVYAADFAEAYYPDSCPPASKIVFHYPERDGLPPVKLVWYDGGMKPDRPIELSGEDMMGDWSGGLIFEGSQGKLMTDSYGNNPRLLPLSKMDDFTPPPETRRRIKEGHYQNWIQAIKGEVDSTTSDFEIAGPLTETILIGNLALRSYSNRKLREGKKPGDWNAWEYTGRNMLHWDSENLKVTNYDEANEFVGREYRQGWELGSGK